MIDFILKGLTLQGFQTLGEFLYKNFRINTNKDLTYKIDNNESTIPRSHYY